MAGIIDSLLAALDSQKRVLGKNVKDLVQDPIGHASKVAGRVKEDLLGAAGGDKAQLTELLSNLMGAGIIKGPSSKLWNSQLAKDALDMEQLGYTAEDIWKATGVYRGPIDGKLRQEIADKGARLRAELPKGYAEKRLSDILDHPELMADYPDLANIRVQTNPAIKGGSYLGKNPYTKTEDMTLGTAGEDQAALSTLLHEIQHAVQQREGFSKGSNLDLAKQMPEFKAGMKNIKKTNWAGDSRSADEINSILEQAISYDLYKRTAGEAEARAVQARQGMEPTDLWDLIPTESYDVLVNKLLRSPKDDM